MTSERRVDVPFRAHVELLRLFLAHRDAIVAKIEGLLNAQRKPVQYLQNRFVLSRHFGDCFFGLREVARDQSLLRGQLEEAHWASGFRPSESPGVHNDLVDPAEMAVRAFHMWRQTRWPGHNGRARYAHTLFDLQLIRCLALLSVRLWDGERSGATEKLSQVQSVLDQLWTTAPAGQPVLVRDARWLIPVALSPTTDELAAYFDVGERIATTLPEEDRIEIHGAVVKLAGGHLRSQLRHSMTTGMSLDDGPLILSTRRSNALDFALLVQSLVPLLEAYEHASQGGDGARRIELAEAICQGVSPDPELLLNRVDLLGPYTMIEHVFVTTDRERGAAYTPMGLRHLRLLEQYKARIGRSAQALLEDAAQLVPVDGAYSPYGVLYGFSSNLIEHMAFKTLQPDAAAHFSLEDAFVGGAADKLSWVNGWRKLPHIPPEVARLFDYPQRFAEDVFARIEQALRTRVAADAAHAVLRAGRLFVLPDEGPPADSNAVRLPDLPAWYVKSSDPQLAAAQRAHPQEPAQLAHERQEGYFLVSYETPGGWAAVTKDVLTEVLGTGHDVKIAGLPRAAAAVLKAMCPNLVELVPPR